MRLVPLMTAEQVVEASLAGLDRRRVRVVAGLAGELYRPRGGTAS